MIIKRKNRYVLVMSSKPIEIGLALDSFINELSKYIGIFGLAELSPYFIKSINERTFIFRVARGGERRFILALSFIKLNGVAFYSLLTSGTIKSLLRRYRTTTTSKKMNSKE